MLLAELERQDERSSQVCANALSRITGYRPLQSLLVPPEALEVPDAPTILGESTEPSLAERVSDPRDLPEDGSPDAITRVCTDPAVWRGFWSESAARFTPGRRYRRGVPHSALAVCNELSFGPCDFLERRALARELVLVSGAYVPFDPSDFVWQQEAHLVEWEAPARAASSRPGAYGIPHRTRGYVPAV